MRRLSGAVLVTLVLAGPAAAQNPSKLRLEQVGSDSTAFNVTATLVIGPSELLVWDSHYLKPDVTRLVERIAATGKKVKAVILSHADHDHFMGATAIVERFPGTPVYMTAAALEQFEKQGRGDYLGEKQRRPALFPDSLVTPSVLPSLKLTVDGEVVEVIADLTGDVLRPSNSVLWIPSLRAALTGDLVFNNVHAWLSSSDEASRARWRDSLKRIAALNPAIVVAGHKRDVGAADSPDVLQQMDRYLADFETLRKDKTSAQELFAAMREKYPEHAVAVLLRVAARDAYRK